MTRINCIPVGELTDQHLMAEYRELPMINASLKRTLMSKNQTGLKTIPSEYTLNSGHVKFFYDKGAFLLERYQQLIDELRQRNYNVDPNSRSVDWSVFCGYNHMLDGTWLPSSTDQQINVKRLITRIQQKVSWYRYYSTPINSTFVENLKEKYIEPTSNV